MSDETTTEDGTDPLVELLLEYWQSPSHKKSLAKLRKRRHWPFRRYLRRVGCHDIRPDGSCATRGHYHYG